MNRQEASLFFRLRVVPCSPVPPNKAMQTDRRFAAAADRQGVRRTPMPRTAGRSDRVAGLVSGHFGYQVTLLTK
jgi:hypothetical protein